MPVSGGVSSRPQNSADILSNVNSTYRVAPRVAQELDDGAMDGSDDEMNEDELQEQEVSYLDAVLLDVVDENEANSVADDPFHVDNWVEENIEDHSGRALRSGNHAPESAPPRSRNFSEGPTNIPEGTTTMGQFMELFFTNAILQTFVDSSNSFNSNLGEKRRRSNSHLLTVQELKKYFAVVLWMGIQRLPNRKMYWSRGAFRSEFVKNCFSKRRFDCITRNLHYKDTSQISSDERKRKNSEDGFWTVEELMMALSESCRHFFRTGQLVDIDEMCIYFKGRHRCKCYNPNKPNKWHFKAFCLNDSKTGYLSNFFLYRGKDERRPANVSATVYPLMKLTEPKQTYLINLALTYAATFVRGRGSLEFTRIFC